MKPQAPTFARMPRWMFRSFALYFVAVMAAPGVLFVQFQARKSYIERELCVQRDVMEDMRTCHGECFLSKRYKALENEAEKGFPSDRLVRFEPVVEVTGEVRAYVLPASAMEWNDPTVPLSDGFGGPVDHVPKG